MGKALCLLLITLAIYYPALSARMVADDFILVHQVTFPDAFHYLRATFGFGRNEYRPVTALSWAFSNFLWSDDPRGYHLENILLHGANAALLFHWIRGLTQNGPMAFVAALFFIVHPIHHSRVTWISARDALISSLFLLLALHTYTTYRQSAVGVSAAKDAGQKRPPLPLVLSLGFFVLSLLSYEGAIILPLMLLLLELFFFGDTAGNIFHKLWVAIQRLRFYIGLAFVYVCFWLILFRGSVVGYDLSLPITSISGNYYALLYRLFHGHQRLAGVLYALLVVIGYGTLRRRRSLAVFSLLWMLAAYLPFCMIRGFADRFAYVSGMGYCLLLALILVPWQAGKKDHLWRWRLAPLALAVVLLSSFLTYYTTELRVRISEWQEAGQIADSMPRQIKKLYPQLPEGSTLVLGRIPRRHGHAHVFPLGLRAAIRRHYERTPLQIYYGHDDLEQVVRRARIKPRNGIRYYFQYVPAQRRLVEVTPLKE